MRIPAVLSVLVLLLAGCQSAPVPAPVPAAPPPAEVPVPGPEPAPVPAVPAPDPSSITAGGTGFSPRAQAPADTLAFGLRFGSPGRILSWAVEFLDSAQNPVRRVTGNPPELPASLSWDGKGEDGTLAPEGLYTARLAVDYGDPQGPSTALSQPFLLDITPPSGTLAVFPRPYEPGDPSVMVHPPTVTIEVNLVPGAAPVASWRLGVLHPDGRRFMYFISEDHRDNRVVWNGRALNNASLEPGTAYDLAVQAFDRYGNSGWIRGTLEVAAAPAPAPVPEPPAAEGPVPGIPAEVTVVLDGKVVAETRIFFPAYSADLGKVAPDLASRNREALDTLAGALGAVPGTRVDVVGHANKVFWEDPVKGDYEQRETLIPLSQARAEAVCEALASLGMDRSGFRPKGIGASAPAAPFGDLANNWKNRRVEFQVLTGPVTGGS